MEKEFLSKNKKIYILSKDGNGFHIAKYPVVYLNHEYTYYKKGAASVLKYVDTGYVSDIFDEKEAERAIRDYCDRYIVTTIRYYWNVADGALKVIKDKKDVIEAQKIKELIEKARSDISLKQAQIRDLNNTILELESKLKWTDR